jgi:hypothetical protein
MDSMPVTTDTLGFDVACAALESAARNLQRLADDPTVTLAALSKAQRHYDLAKARWLQFEWQLRAAAAHGLKPPPLRVGPLLIVGVDKAVRESLAVLLAVKGCGRPKSSAFDAFDYANASGGQLVILDVPWHSVTAARWFIDGFGGASDKPHIIALAPPEYAEQFGGKVDRVVAKPLMLQTLLQAITDIDRTVAVLTSRTTVSAATTIPLPASGIREYHVSG